MERKDYYKILGVSKDASDKELKKAYKKLSMKFHPDRNVGKSEAEQKEAEEKFKDINEAYSVLSDPKKKAEYDNPMSGFGGGGFDFGGFNPFKDFDPFGGFGGFGGFGKQSQQQVQGQSIRITVGVTLEDVLNGVTKTIKYNRKGVCTSCDGSGKTAQSREEMCTHCGGTGTLITQNGAWQTMTTCPHCKGKGINVINPCTHCHGTGLADESHQVEINIPKGAHHGVSYIMNGQGSAAPQNKGPHGDLVIVINELPHEKFVREGINLIQEINIPVLDGMIGCTIEVDTLDGKTLATKIKPGVEYGDKIRFKGKGLPHPNNGQVGDMIGIINLIMPKSLNEEEIRLINELKEQEHFKRV